MAKEEDNRRNPGDSAEGNSAENSGAGASEERGARRRPMPPRGFPPPPPGFPPPFPPGMPPPPGFPPPPGYLHMYGFRNQPHFRPPPPRGHPAPPSQFFDGDDYVYEECEEYEEYEGPEEYEEYEVEIDENGDEYEIVEEVVYVDESFYLPERPKNRGLDPVEVSRMDGVEQIQSRGAETSRKAENIESARSITVTFLKIFTSVVILAAMVSSAVILIKHTSDSAKERHKASAREQLARVEDETPAPVFKWKLLDNMANSIVKKFYQETGTLESFAAITDIMLKGEVEFSDATMPFYCIKKRDGRAFLKISSDDESKCYYIDQRGKVWFLPEGGVAGRREPLKYEESEKIRALTIFDDALAQRAFPPDEHADVYNSMINYEGAVKFEGEMKECISTVDMESRRTMFYINPHTSLISGLTVAGNGLSFKIIFSKYSGMDENLKIPEIRDVYFGDKIYAKVSLNMAVKNRDMMFPQ